MRSFEKEREGALHLFTQKGKSNAGIYEQHQQYIG
jgi:hypothetical protein